MTPSVRIAWRSLLRSPGFALAALATLTMGIAASTIVFTALNAVLFKPLPYRDSDRLMGAWFAVPGMGALQAPQTLATYFTYKHLAHSIEGIGAVQPASVNVVADPGQAPERVRATGITASTF